MDVVDALEGFWNAILDLTSKFVIPDWGALIGLLPIFLLIGVLGPILSILVLVHLIYFLRKPRVAAGGAAEARSRPRSAPTASPSSRAASPSATATA